MIDYRDVIFNNVIQPERGIRRIQSGVTALASGTTTVPISTLVSPANKVYIVTSHFDADRNTGSQGYTATLDHSQNEIEISVADSSFAGSVSWQVIEVY